jgi:hypothetical protein
VPLILETISKYSCTERKTGDCTLKMFPRNLHSSEKFKCFGEIEIIPRN